MRQWLDVQPGDWFYNEVMEASNYVLEDGSPLITGHPYNKFMVPKVYQEFKGTGGQVDFTISTSDDIVPTPANPLYVYVDGVQTIYKGVNGKTVTLYAAPRSGAKVTLMMQGKPWVDENGRPSQVSAGIYPSHTLQYAGTYYWNPIDGRHLEYCYAYGRQLRRAPIPEDDWNVSEPQAIVKKYIGDSTDMYAISPHDHPYAAGTIYLSMNLTNVTCTLTYFSKESDGVIYKRGGDFKALSSSPMWNDRYFPNSYMTRAEAYSLIGRLRDSFYQRFTDVDPPNGNFTEYVDAYGGQRVFKLGHRFTKGGNELTVYHIPSPGVQVKFDLGEDYTEFDDHTVLLTIPATDGQRFKFVGTHVSKFPDVESSDWFYPYISAMEVEKLRDGSPLISGRTNPTAGQPDIFAPSEMIKRSEAAAFLNRFRKWCIERFKY